MIQMTFYNHKAIKPEIKNQMITRKATYILKFKNVL